METSRFPFNNEKYAKILRACEGLSHKQRRSFIKREKRRLVRIRNAHTKTIFYGENDEAKDFEEENATANKLWLEYEEQLKEKARKILEEHNKKVEQNLRNKQEENPMDKETEINNLLLTIDEELKEWHNPFAPEGYQDDEVEEDQPIHKPIIGETEDKKSDDKTCSFFDKVGVCRFGNACSRTHNYPTKSCVILFQNMLNLFAFDMSSRITRNMDVDLEYSDSELKDDFKQFQKDVLDELKKYGNIVQFKVCCNREPHLQGNVYVQYKTELEAQLCFDKTNGRFYNKKIMLPKFISIPSWRTAICGMDYNKKACPHGRKCNFLDVFYSRRFKYADCDDFSRPSAHKEKKHKSQSQSKEKSHHKKYKKHKKKNSKTKDI